MTNRQNNSINMINTTNDALQAFKRIWEGRRPFAAQAAVVKEVAESLQSLFVARGRDNTGIAEDKASYQLHAAVKADYIGDIIQAYALDINDRDLYRSMMFSASDIIRMADPESHAKLLEVYTAGTRLFEKLEDYGLEQDDLDELKSDTDHFKQQMPAPRTAIGEKKGAGEQIEDLISRAGEALHRLDKMINTFAKQSPEFVSRYKSARQIVDLGGGGKVKGKK